MTAISEVVDLINQGGANIHMHWAAIGFRIGPFPAFYALGSGNKLVTAAQVTDNPVLVLTSLVDEVIKMGDGFSVRIDASFDEHALEISTVKTQAEIDAWSAAFAETDGLTDWMTSEAKNRLDQMSGADPAERLSVLKYARWSGFDMKRGELVPMGVIVVNDDEDLAAVAFPGYEADAGAINGRRVSLENAPAQVADQLTMISAPMKIKATDWEDALRRGLYAFAKDHYKKTGRSVYA